ncbi:MAG TPA: hypothetical protein VKX17_11900 [Planctomycetota bacterium]|nr:hypothetical protein [Planctomycetota bacterium]
MDRRTKVSVLRGLSRIRLGDAWALLKTQAHERRNGAIYIAGYSVECALKVKICELKGKKSFDPFKDPDLIDLKIHNLWLLAERGGLLKRIVESPDNLRALKYMSNWVVTWRYQLRFVSYQEVEVFLKQAEGFNTWLLGK